MKRAQNITRRVTQLLTLLLAPMVLGNSCDPALNDNPDFEFWCNDTPCGWALEAGQVERAPTWRRGDDGVRLIGPRVVMEQALEIDAGCIAVSVLTDVPDGATMTIEFDFLDDGQVEHVHPLDGQNWKHLDFKLSAPINYDTVRVRVRKLGDPPATLARLRIGRGSDCLEDPIMLRDLGEGLACAEDEACASGECVPDRYCDLIDADGFVPCETDADCEAHGSARGCFDFPTGVCSAP